MPGIIIIVSLLTLCFSQVVQGAAAPHYGPFPDGIRNKFRNVKDSGARGDGVTDDTEALQNALNAAMNYGRSNHKQTVLYFPNGTYLVSNTLRAHLDSKGLVHLILLGESRENTCIRLKDNTFTGSPTPVITHMAPSWAWHNTAFWNSAMNLTIDIGSGNTGAIGFIFHNNNNGILENVCIKSSDPSGRGHIGLSLDKWACGLTLTKHLEVQGFDYGISARGSKIQHTFEHIVLKDQRIAGARLRGRAVQFRDLTSVQSRAGVPAIVTEKANNENGNTIVLESHLQGKGPATGAIVNNNGLLFVRDVTAVGYQSVIRDHGRTISGTAVTEYLRGKCYQLFPSSHRKSLGLKIKDTPTVPWDSRTHFNGKPSPRTQTSFGYTVGSWAVVTPAGGNVENRIQAAIDNGRPTVALEPSGTFQLNSTVTIRGNVRRFHGCWSTVDPSTAMRSKPIPLFRIAEGNHDTVVIQCFRKRRGTYGKLDAFMPFRNESPKTIVMRNIECIHGPFYSSSDNSGPLFMEKCVKHGTYNDPYSINCFDIKNSEVYIRCNNPEGFNWAHFKYSRAGGTMVMLGVKVGENAGAYFKFTNGCTVEMLGGYINAIEPDFKLDGVDDHTEFIIDESTVSIIGIAEGANGPNGYHPSVVTETLNGTTRNMAHPGRGGPMPTRRQGGSKQVNISMYRSGKDPNHPTRLAGGHGEQAVPRTVQMTAGGNRVSVRTVPNALVGVFNAQGKCVKMVRAHERGETQITQVPRGVFVVRIKDNHASGREGSITRVWVNPGGATRR